MARMQRFLPLKEFAGRGSHGEVCYLEVFGDPHTGEVVTPTRPDGEKVGWDGAPGNRPSGSVEHEATERGNHAAYRIGWERIFGVQGETHGQ